MRNMSARSLALVLAKESVFGPATVQAGLTQRPWPCPLGWGLWRRPAGDRKLHARPPAG